MRTPPAKTPRAEVGRITISMSPAEKKLLTKRAAAENKSVSALIVELCNAGRDAKDSQIYAMSSNIEQLTLGLEAVARQLRHIKENQRIPAASLVAQCHARVEDLHKRAGISNPEKVEKETGEAISAYLELGDGLLKTYGATNDK
jgi:hypothetical protein